ncbi:MAG: ATP-dependent helicase, partial [Burkholderiales bacterium]|nr:ATP-dependent helicase [Burkholderiales bacterium]
PQSRPQSRPADPIFSKPYEPGTAPAVARVAEPAVHPKRRERPVAALLGGLKRA